jgi:hypothetical protein
MPCAGPAEQRPGPVGELRTKDREQRPRLLQQEKNKNKTSEARRQARGPVNRAPPIARLGNQSQSGRRVAKSRPKTVVRSKLETLEGGNRSWSVAAKNETADRVDSGKHEVLTGTENEESYWCPDALENLHGSLIGQNKNTSRDRSP